MKNIGNKHIHEWNHKWFPRNEKNRRQQKKLATTYSAFYGYTCLLQFYYVSKFLRGRLVSSIVTLLLT